MLLPFLLNLRMFGVAEVAQVTVSDAVVTGLLGVDSVVTSVGVVDAVVTGVTITEWPTS